MINKIIKFFVKSVFIIFIALLILTVYRNSVYAVTDTIGTFYAQNSGTNWELWARYYSAVYGTQSLPSPFWLDISNSSGVMPNIPTNSRFRQWDLPISFNPGDSVKWKTACADPVDYISPTFGAYEEGNVYNYLINATCPSSNSVGGHPASCNTVTNRGYVPVNDWCPSGPYCMYFGDVYTAGTAWCPGAFVNTPPKGVAPGSCGSGGTCNYYYCTLRNGGGYCNYLQDTTGAYCGSACGSAPPPPTSECQMPSCSGSPTTIPNSNMCSGSSYSCSPAAPSLSLSTGCSGTTAYVNAVWSDDSLYTNYDLRYMPSGGSWTQSCAITPANNTYTISNLTDSTSYNVQVRAHTPNGVNGPTNFSCGTITTNTCACVAPPAPTNLQPNGTISSGTQNITWNAVSGVTTYALRIDDLSTPWSNNCSVAQYGGDVCNDNVTSTSYPYNFQSGKSYSIWVHALAGCNSSIFSSATYASVTILNSLTVHVFNDYNGNGTEDASDTPASGRSVTITGIGSGTFTTDTNGNVVRNNLLSGNSTITASTPSGWTSTTTNPRTVTLPPSQVVNFGIKPPAPTCSGITAATNPVTNPTSVLPGGTATLTCTNPTSTAGITPTYIFSDDPAISGDSVNPINTANPTSTWTAPSPYYQQVTAHPYVSICNPGGTAGSSACNSYTANIIITPRFSISGSVFLDDNENGNKDGGERFNASLSTVQIRTGSCNGTLVQTITSSNNGAYNTNTPLAGGAYFVCYTSLPLGYRMTVPINGPPASFAVTLGNGSTGGSCSPAANCDANGNGNLTNLNFGITNSIPWIQVISGDSYSRSGVSNPIPAGASCQSYMSIQGSQNTPGVVFTGNGSAYFGAGQASTTNWVAGGSTYPNIYTPKGSEIKTSYNTMYQKAVSSGNTPTPLGTTQCGAGGIGNCVLSTTLANGIYVANGNLTLTGASYTFPGSKDFVILVNGNLNINTEIHVPTTSTVLFSASGDISVASSVGETTITSTRSNVEGYFSTDKNFYVLGGNSCPTSDRRLNVAGSIVVNAAFTGGSFVYQRTLCGNNLECPVFSVIERPDFILNAPEFIKTTRRIWQEIAP